MIQRLSTFVIDTGFNEPAWADPLSWSYIAKVNPATTTFTPSQPSNTALFNISVSTTIMRGRTQYLAGSTSFPDNIGDKRIYIVCDVWLEFVRADSFFTQIDLTSVEWQLIGPIQ
jgi:hypothetical protein